MSTPIEPPPGAGQAGLPEVGQPEARQPEARQPEAGPHGNGGQPQARQPQPPTTPHLPTILSGLVVLTVTVLVALAKLTDVEVDLGLVLPVGMVATGALLVLGAVLAAVRAGRRAEA